MNKNLLGGQHNKKFKADKPVKPVCGLSNCYVDARTGALVLRNIKICRFINEVQNGY